MNLSVLPSQLLFLPGALGRTQLWEPVARRLVHPASKKQIGWPGFGSIPSDPLVNSIDDLVRMVAAEVDQPTALIAQSMGGVIAARVALEQHELLTHLVLAVTSGGMDVGSLGAEDWRPSFHESNPHLPRWFSHDQQDLSPQLQTIRIPTLLLWGNSDPISPVSIGERLASLLPSAQLRVVAGGDHDLAETHASEVAALIDEFLATSAKAILTPDGSSWKRAATGQ
jgi:pimeloyl-ACP methyl ester carboxylesterase